MGTFYYTKTRADLHRRKGQRIIVSKSKSGRKIFTLRNIKHRKKGGRK